MTVGMPEFVENQERRCPLVLLLDCSSSMSGEPIGQVNDGLQTLAQELQADEVAAARVEVAIVTFGGTAALSADFTGAMEFQPSRLSASGGTPMGAAISMGLDALERRKQDYRKANIPYYRPWVFLLTDGAPTDSWEASAARVHQGEKDRRFSFFAVGVEGADFTTLGQIAPPSRPPLKLKGAAWRQMFLWLSGSVSSLANSDPSGGDQMVATDPIDSWGQVPTA